MISTTVKAIGTACTVAAALAVTIVPTAAAKGDDGIRVAGTCSDGSSSKLKVKHDDGRIEAEFEVDQNRNGVAWNVDAPPRRPPRLRGRPHDPRAERLLQRRAQDRRRRRQRGHPCPRHAQRRGLHGDGQAAGAQRGHDRRDEERRRGAGRCGQAARRRQRGRQQRRGVDGRRPRRRPQRLGRQRLGQQRPGSDDHGHGGSDD